MQYYKVYSWLTSVASENFRKVWQHEVITFHGQRLHDWSLAACDENLPLAEASWWELGFMWREPSMAWRFMMGGLLHVVRNFHGLRLHDGSLAVCVENLLWAEASWWELRSVFGVGQASAYDKFACCYNLHERKGNVIITNFHQLSLYKLTHPMTRH